MGGEIVFIYFKNDIINYNIVMLYRNFKNVNI